VNVAQRAESSTTPGVTRPQGRRRLRPTRVVLGVVGAGLVGVWLYSLGLHIAAGQVNSDGATVVLQGRAMSTGNLLLHGWNLSLDSWWTLDVPFYALAILLVGVRKILLLAVPATIATLIVVAAVVLARRGRRGRGALAGAAVAAAVLLLPSPALATDLLVGPIHQSTTLFALGAFVGLRRNRFGPGWVLAVVLLAAGLLGDLQIFSYGVVPILLAGGVAMLRRRSLGAGVPAVSASLAAGALALAVHEAAIRLGGFDIGPTNPHASYHQMTVNLTQLPAALSQLLGVTNTAYGRAGEPPALLAFHVVFAAVLVVAFVVSLWRMLVGIWRARAEEPDPASRADPAARSARVGSEPEPWRVDDMLLIAITGPVVDYVALSLVTQNAYLRYLTASVVFAAVLAGRVVTRWWSSSPPFGLRSLGIGVGGLSAACLLAASGFALTHPPQREQAAVVADFLEAHHLTSGVGDYWAASVVTVETDERVRVRPVEEAPDGRLEAFDKGPQRAWFAHAEFDFVVFSAPVGYDDVSAATATATWGPPAHSYQVGQYDVLVWTRGHRITQYAPN